MISNEQLDSLLNFMAWRGFWKQQRATFMAKYTSRLSLFGDQILALYAKAKGMGVIVETLSEL